MIIYVVIYNMQIFIYTCNWREYVWGGGQWGWICRPVIQMTGVPLDI